jgi:hypothetical protein
VVIGSVHLADIGARARLAALTGGRVDARFARTVLAAGLRGSFLTVPDRRRVGLIAFWDDDYALDAFLASHPLAELLSDGWHARLAPVRASGDWPGLPTELPRDHAVGTDGPAAVLTLGQVRGSQLVRFRKFSAAAEARLADADGLVWATGLARPWRPSRCGSPPTRSAPTPTPTARTPT